MGKPHIKQPIEHITQGPCKWKCSLNKEMRYFTEACKLLSMPRSGMLLQGHENLYTMLEC